MVVACTRDLSALITFNANSFIGAPFVWADRVLPLPYPSLSRQLYAELVCHLCPKGDTGQLLLDYGFMVSTRALAVLPLSSHSTGNVTHSIRFIDGACCQP
jgi:hypothetical protein